MSSFRSALRGFLLALLAASPLYAADTRKVVIPFDFVSKFDNNRYGQMIGDMLWTRLSRDGRFIIPESMLEVRDFCTSHNLSPSSGMSLEEMKRIVRGDFDAQIGIWGSVERATGNEAEIYDLTIKCVDFSAQPNPRVIYEVRAKTQSVSEIPHLYVKQMFDALYGRQPDNPTGPNPVAEEGWRRSPNLVTGDFEHGRGGVPKGWSDVAGQLREPLGGLVQWTAEQGDSRNKVVRFTLDKQVAENEGAMYYSDFFPVEEGATYRFQCRWRSDGPTVKVFIKCYDEEEGQRREVYRSQQNLKGPKNTWNTQTEDFAPKHVKYSPKWGRVMLYAYFPTGVVEFDDVVVKQIIAASTGQTPKVRRPSRETKITIEEMQENERRSRKTKEKAEP